MPVPPDPGAADAARRAAAARKAETTPHLLSDAEVCLLPGRKVLELGNAGHLRHLGIGLPVPKPKAAKRTAGRPERGMVGDAELGRMSGEEIRKAAAAGRIPGIGARRQTWGR